jgi:hypothetical protein
MNLPPVVAALKVSRQNYAESGRQRIAAPRSQLPVGDPARRELVATRTKKISDDRMVLRDDLPELYLQACRP